MRLIEYLGDVSSTCGTWGLSRTFPGKAKLALRSATFGEEAFANLAIGLIGRFVREVRVDAQQSFRIVFTDGTEFK